MPKISEMLPKLQGSQWVMSQDQNMGNFTIKLDLVTSKINIIILFLAKFSYKNASSVHGSIPKYLSVKKVE